MADSMINAYQVTKVAKESPIVVQVANDGPSHDWWKAKSPCSLMSVEE